MTAGAQRLLMPPAAGCLVELRRWAHSWMDQHPTDGVDPDSVVLSMTELVTNSIKHGAGRGMLILESLATRWGVQAEPGVGKTVWCEFASR